MAGGAWRREIEAWDGISSNLLRGMGESHNRRSGSSHFTVGYGSG